MELIYMLAIAFAVQLTAFFIHRYYGTMFSGLITTVALIYGIFLFGHSDTYMVFNGFELSRNAFLLFIFAWYTFDFGKFYMELAKRIKAQEAEAALAGAAHSK